jgi:hypothetical protein
MLNSDFSYVRNYSEIINETLSSIEKIKSNGIVIPDDSWLHKALNHAKLVELHSSKGTLQQITSQNSVRWKTTVIFGNLSEFNFIFTQFNTLLELNGKIFIKKLREVLKMPLTVLGEDAASGSNQGRNTLFELRLSARLAQAKFKPQLTSDHPDILVSAGMNEYAIECKRVFSKYRFEKLTLDAIDQLKNYTLSKFPHRIGLVAVSITRHFHQGDMKINAKNPEQLGRFADKEIETFIKSKSDFIRRSFPDRIPGIFLDYSDFAECDRPYWLHWLFFVGTGDGNENDPIKTTMADLHNLLNYKSL